MGTETALSTETANAFDPNKIAADVTTTLITEAIKSGWQKVKNFFQDSDAKDSIDYGDAYSDYLSNTIKKNSLIKTLIYRDAPKPLYSFYECPNVRYKGQILDTSRIQSILDLNNKLLITGTGGIGKSLLLKHFFLITAQYGYYIPVLIELRKFNHLEIKDISLYHAIYQSLSDNGFKLKTEYYSYSLEQGGYLILLDGFDEVNRDRAEIIYEEIKSFSSRYNKNHFIVSSRPSDRFIAWNDFHEIALCGLTKNQALYLIQKIDFDEAIKKPFSKALNSKLYEKYQSFISNPLLLTIMLLTYSNHAALPENLNSFYEQAFSALFDRHDATKGYFKRDIRSHLSYDDFKIVFGHMCICSYFSGDFEFSEDQLRRYIQKAKEKVYGQSFSVDEFKEDLILSVCMLVKDGLNYRFIHRSFQEYFAAWYTCKLSDKDQHDLLTNWISSSTSSLSDSYMSMLFDFQKDKVNKIILYPGIKRLKNLYNTCQFSLTLLNRIFTGFGIIEKRHENGQVSYISNLIFKDQYLCSIVQLTCILNGYSFAESTALNIRTQNILQKIVSYKGLHHAHYISFNEALSIVSEDDLLYCLKWYDSCLLFCFEIYSKYLKNSASNNRSISNILANI